MWPRQRIVRLTCNAARSDSSLDHLVNTQMSADVIPSNSFKSRLNLDFFEAMAERSDAAPARWRWLFLAWLDGVEKGWGIPVLIVGFAAAWMLFLTIAYLSGDLHPDVLEAWAVGQSFAWGNAKHPPLMGWVAHAWTLVFPLTDWSFRLLAMINAALALWAVDLIACRFVRGDKRAVVLLLLPAYQFRAQRFNANAVLLAFWPLATYCLNDGFTKSSSTATAFRSIWLTRLPGSLPGGVTTGRIASRRSPTMPGVSRRARPSSTARSSSPLPMAPPISPCCRTSSRASRRRSSW
jgi:hypothetical protein